MRIVPVFAALFVGIMLCAAEARAQQATMPPDARVTSSGHTTAP